MAAVPARPTPSLTPSPPARGRRGRGSATGSATGTAAGTAADGGYILVSTLVKLVVTLAIVGTVGYDSFSLMAAHLKVQDDASQAVSLAHDKLKSTGSAAAAYAVIQKFAKEQGDTIVPDSFRIGPKRAVTISFTRTASTIAASHVPGVKQYVVATATSTSTDPLA